MIRPEDGPDDHLEVRGHYRWIDEGSPRARIAGDLVVPRGEPGLPRGDAGDLFYAWGVGEFRGRAARLSIEGVGLSPVRIYSNGQTRRQDLTTPVSFEAWLPPVPIVDRRELAEALRTPIADALEQAGQADLAGLARAAAVALVGFPRPARSGSK